MQSKIQEITKGKAGEIYSRLLETVEYSDPHQFIDTAYRRYLSKCQKNPAINGKVFEFLICETLAHEEILPFYYQAKFERVPNVDFDIVFYQRKAPLALSLKVSLRERYKQADLEGMALKQVYRKAKNLLITLADSEVGSVINKIKTGDIMGLDECILANKKEYSQLLLRLKKDTFEKSEPLQPLTGQYII